MKEVWYVPSPLGVLPQTTSSGFFPLSSRVLDEASSDFEPDTLRRRSSPWDMEKGEVFEERRRWNEVKSCQDELENVFPTQTTKSLLSFKFSEPSYYIHKIYTTSSKDVPFSHTRTVWTWFMTTQNNPKIWSTGNTYLISRYNSAWFYHFWFYQPGWQWLNTPFKLEVIDKTILKGEALLAGLYLHVTTTCDGVEYFSRGSIDLSDLKSLFQPKSCIYYVTSFMF